MSSTWIKILSSLPDNPDIERMVNYLDRLGDDRGSIPICLGSETGAWMEERQIQRNCVIGGLCRVWIWANKYAKPGTDDLFSYPDGYHKIDGRLEQLDSVAGINGFGGAMLEVRWVDHVDDEQRDIEFIVFSDFDRHNVTECDRAGKSTSAERMRRKRKKDKEPTGQSEDSPSPSPSPVTPCDSNVTQISSYSYSSSGSSEGGAGGEERKWTHWARFVLDAYPKGKIGPRSSAMKAACRLLEKISLLPDSSSEVDAVVQHAVFLAGRFADAVGDSQYIPHLRTWVDDGWWEMAEEEWASYGRDPKEQKQEKAQKRQDRASEALRQERQAEAEDEEKSRQEASEAKQRAADLVARLEADDPARLESLVNRAHARWSVLAGRPASSQMVARAVAQLSKEDSDVSSSGS